MAIVRDDDGRVAIALSLRTDGDIEVGMSKKDAKAFLGLLALAVE